MGLLSSNEQGSFFSLITEFTTPELVPNSLPRSTRLSAVLGIISAGYACPRWSVGASYLATARQYLMIPRRTYSGASSKLSWPDMLLAVDVDGGGTTLERVEEDEAESERGRPAPRGRARTRGTRRGRRSR